MKNYVQDGNVLSHTAAADITSGDVVIMGILAGIALGDIASGDVGEVAVSGVVSLAKTSANTPAQGAAAYWTGTEVTTTVGTNDRIGVFAHAYISGDVIADVLLNVAT